MAACNWNLTPRVYIKLNMDKTPSKIVVLAPNWLGDAAMCTPALRALHQRFRQAEITIGARPAICQLLEGMPGVVRTIPLRGKGPLELARAAWQLRPHARDLAVVFPHSFRAALLAFLTGARTRLGYDRNHRGFLLTDRVEPYREDGVIQPIYMSKEYMELVTALGCEDDGRGLELRLAPASIKRAQTWFGDKRPRIGFAPGAAFGPSKCWPADRYARVADALAERYNAYCVLMTGPGEESIRDAVQSAARHPLKIPGESLQGVEGLKAVMSQLDLLICNDSGARHVAVAFGVPTVCIMGPTSARYSTGPYEKGRLLRVDVPCGPCQKPVCVTGDHRCMTEISDKLVFQAAMDVLVTEKIVPQM